MPARRRLLAFVAYAFAALAIAPDAFAQDEKPPESTPQPEGTPQEKDEGDAKPKRNRKKRDPAERERNKKRKETKEAAEKEPAGEPANIVPCPAIGCTIDTLQFVDVAATEDGRRTEFGEIPAGTAFEVWVEGKLPRKSYVTEPDPDKPGETRQVQKTMVSVLRVSEAEWDQYRAFMQQDQATLQGGLSTFLNVVTTVLLRQKAVLLFYRDELPDIEKRAAVVIEKLREGTPFNQVVRVHCEDEVARGAGGLFLDDTRGAMLSNYPFAKALFEMKPGEVCGPLYNSTAAYIVHIDRVTPDPNPRFTKVRASAVTLKYVSGAPTPGKEMGAVQDMVRVRTNQERFLRLLPPGIQVPPPKTFGPDDVAPVGKPDAPLKSAFDGGP